MFVLFLKLSGIQKVLLSNLIIIKKKYIIFSRFTNIFLNKSLYLFVPNNNKCKQVLLKFRSSVRATVLSARAFKSYKISIIFKMQTEYHRRKSKRGNSSLNSNSTCFQFTFRLI